MTADNQARGGISEAERRHAATLGLVDGYAGIIHELDTKLAAAEARAAKAVEVLRKSEPDLRYCSVCDVGLYQGESHTDDCALATLLSDHPAPEPGVDAGEVRNG